MYAGKDDGNNMFFLKIVSFIFIKIMLIDVTYKSIKSDLIGSGETKNNDFKRKKTLLRDICQSLEYILQKIVSPSGSSIL